MANHLPRLTRQKKLRHQTNPDLEVLEQEEGAGGCKDSDGCPSSPVTRLAYSLESSPAISSWTPGGPVPRPLPLPRPEATPGYQLPSPPDLQGRVTGEEATGTSESSSSLGEPIGKRLSAAGNAKR